MQRLTYIIVFLLFAKSVLAQSGTLLSNERAFFGGVVVGANLCTVQGDGYSGYSKVGLNAGGMVYAKIANKLFADLELLYAQKGSRGVNQVESIYVGTSFEKYYLDLNYVEIPLVFNYVFNEKWHGGIGGSYALLLGSKEDAVSAVQPVYIKNDEHPFKKNDINFILNLGYELGGGVFVNARYQRSVTTIRDPFYVPVGFGGGNQYNELFSFRIMYLIK